MRIGIDLGGTKIEIIALSEEGEPVFGKRVATPQGDYWATVETIAALVKETERKLGVKAVSVGVGSPGAESRISGLMKNSNSTCLNGMPLHSDLEQVLERRVVLANDANCFALSEAVDGAGAGQDCVFGVILGTGVGGGVVIKGKGLAGINAISGEWGHNPLPWPTSRECLGSQCYCGLTGCIETWLSGPGLQKAHARRSGEMLQPHDIVLRAEQGCMQAEQSLLEYEDRLARGLASVINIIDPDVIVLGGGLSNIKRLYSNVPARWLNYIFSDSVATRLIQAKHGDASGVRGAAWLGG